MTNPIREDYVFPPKKQWGREKPHLSGSRTIKERTPSNFYFQERIKRCVITKAFRLDPRSDTVMNARLKGNIFVSFKSLATPTVLIHPRDKGSSESYFTIFIISQKRKKKRGTGPQPATHRIYQR